MTNQKTLRRDQIIAKLRAEYQTNAAAEHKSRIEATHICAEWNRIDAELERHGIELCEVEA
jgi:hypothetical protein